MTTTTLKKRINKTIKKLPKEKLQVVDDFVSYLAERNENNAATKELLVIPGFLKRLRIAEKEIDEGKVYDYDKIKRNV
jgi:hypothetical protein